MSSSGHLAIVSRVFFADDAGASFTAVTQLGTEAGRADVLRARHRPHRQGVVCRTVRHGAPRQADYRLGWYVIIGTIPIGVLGLLFKDEIRTARKQSVDDRDCVDRVLRGDRRRRVLRQADPPRRTAHVARQRDSSAWPSAWRWCRVCRAPARRSARACSSGWIASWPRALRLPAGDSCRVRLWLVLAARRLPSRRRGDERQRPAASGRHR